MARSFGCTNVIISDVLTKTTFDTLFKGINIGGTPSIGSNGGGLPSALDFERFRQTLLRAKWIEEFH
uniref:Aldedh domain-containing protein n=1 Tax=Steinernema glaseri TaxID=37863 RepID=A0A1I7Y6A7_9BILA